MRDSPIGAQSRADDLDEAHGFLRSSKETRCNRIEEAYGDAKNLRGRHPLQKSGLLFAIRSTAFKIERATALELIDLLVELAQETDGYDEPG